MRTSDYSFLEEVIYKSLNEYLKFLFKNCESLEQVLWTISATALIDEQSACSSLKLMHANDSDKQRDLDLNNYKRSSNVIMSYLIEH